MSRFRRFRLRYVHFWWRSLNDHPRCCSGSAKIAKGAKTAVCRLHREFGPRQSKAEVSSRPSELPAGERKSSAGARRLQCILVAGSGDGLKYWNAERESKAGFHIQCDRRILEAGNPGFDNDRHTYVGRANHRLHNGASLRARSQAIARNVRSTRYNHDCRATWVHQSR